MIVLLMRSRAINAPLSFVSGISPTTREEAEKQANRLAKEMPNHDFFVFEAVSQHSARIEVDVKRP